jgi:hypothetical protein
MEMNDTTENGPANARSKRDEAGETAGPSTAALSDGQKKDYAAANTTDGVTDPERPVVLSAADEGRIEGEFYWAEQAKFSPRTWRVYRKPIGSVYVVTTFDAHEERNGTVSDFIINADAEYRAARNQVLAEVDEAAVATIKKLGRVEFCEHDPEWPKDEPKRPWGVGFYDGRYEEFESSGEGDTFTEALFDATKALTATQEGTES